MNKKSLFIAALFAPLLAAPVFAEPHQVVLDLERVLQLVNENNRDVAVARQNTQVSRQAIKEANASKLPDINASLSVSYIGDATILNRNFSHITAAATPHLGNTLDVTLYQPVYMGGAISAGVKLAESQSQMSENQLEITRQNVSINAVGCYLELFKAYNLRNVYDENIAMTERLLTDINARYKEGIVLKNDVTRYELRLSTLNYDRLTLNNRISVLNHDLCLLLGLDEDTEIVADVLPNISNLPAVETKNYWTDMAMSNSPSIRALDIRSNINNQQSKLIKAEYLPHVGLVAGDTFDGPITFELPPINKNLNVWYVGVNVSYNISSLFKTPKSVRKNALEREEISYSRDALSDHINSTIDNTFTNYTQAFSMLQTEEKNVELANENYQLVENRYNNQLALLTDMLDASTAKLDAEVRLVNARVNIIYYYYQLKYNSGTL
jgi:outer membrane protein TolC